MLERVANQAATGVVAECLRVAVEHPEDAHDSHRGHAHHYHVQDALRADHAAVEERQAWGHQQHQGRACEHPGSVTGVWHGSLLCVEHGTTIGWCVWKE